jgi:hypothetical protein
LAAVLEFEKLNGTRVSDGFERDAQRLRIGLGCDGTKRSAEQKEGQKFHGDANLQGCNRRKAQPPCAFNFRGAGILPALAAKRAARFAFARSWPIERAVDLR